MTHHRGGFCSINSIQPLLSQVTNGRHAYCAHRASGWDLSKRSVSQKELLADGQRLENITVVFFFKCVLATGIPFLQTMIFFGFQHKVDVARSHCQATFQTSSGTSHRHQAKFLARAAQTLPSGRVLPPLPTPLCGMFSYMCSRQPGIYCYLFDHWYHVSIG